MNQRVGQRGQALPLIGLALMVILGFAAATIDLSYLEYQQQRMQSAADAGALAGARQLIAGGCPDSAAATTAALANSKISGFASGPNVNVTVDNPPKVLDGPYQGNDCAVYVSVNVPQNSDWFMKFFGAPVGAPVTTSAVALMESDTNNSCIFLLNPKQKSTFSSAIISAPSCGILINDTAKFASANITAALIGYAGAAPNGGTFPASTPAPMLQSEDPCPEIPGCAAIAANPPSTSSCGTFIGSGTASPGCYSSFAPTGDVTLLPGTYVLSGTSNFKGITINGTDVTFYVPAGATPPDFTQATGGAFVSSGNASYSNVLYYQVPANAGDPAFGGPLTNITGLIYAPGANNASYCCTTGQVVLVFGGATFEPAAAPANAMIIPSASSMIRRVVLVE